MKIVKKCFLLVLILPIVIMTGFLFTACGEDKSEETTYLTDVTTMDFIDQVIVTEQENKLNLIGVIFNKDIPQTNIEAEYLDNDIILQRTVIEDYNGPDSGVFGYQYSYSFANPPEKLVYDKKPIEIKVKVSDKYYKFGLTTDLIDKIIGM